MIPQGITEKQLDAYYKMGEDYYLKYFKTKNMNVKEFIDDTILKRAIDVWGFNAQCEMIIEECMELALAMQKLKRKRGDKDIKLSNVIDEIADVKIMLRQAERMFPIDMINERVVFKMNRLEERLNENNPL